MPFVGNRTQKTIIVTPYRNRVILPPLGVKEISKNDLEKLKESKVGAALLDRGQLVVAQTRGKIEPIAEKRTTEKKAPGDVKPPKSDQKVKGGTAKPVTAKLETPKA